MQKLLFILLLNIPIFAFCQIKDKMDAINPIEDAQAYQVRCTYQKDNGKLTYVRGYGLVLNGEYLATCYHLLSDKDTSGNPKLKAVYVLYNLRDGENDKLAYDSVLATSDFRAGRNQYDFSKHIYKPQIHSTDFVILKLKKAIPKVNYEFSTRQLNVTDTLFAKGYTWDEKKDGTRSILYTLYDGELFMFYDKITSPDTYYIITGGHAKDGFSGTPLYDSDGKILGIIQGGFDKLTNRMLDLFRYKYHLPDDVIQKIKNIYLNGGNLVISIDIHFLIEKYLKGYLNQ